MRILALDYGTARIGCAICDPSGTVVRPLPVLEPADPEAAARLAADEEADLVLVGMPLTMAGEEGAQAAATRAFVAELERRLDAPVETYDERLTTRMALASRRAGAAAPEDSLAAAHLLEGYLAAWAGRDGEDDD
jgi:putative Holliday junction resolvase